MTALLGRHAAESPVCFGAGGARDAAQLAAYALAIARALPSAPAGSRVVLACVDRYRFSAALLAAWLRGFVAELPPNGQPASVRALAHAAGAVALLHDREGEFGLDVRPLESTAARAPLPFVPALASDQVALIAYTSGSTGAPVAHPKTLGQLLREPEAHVLAFDLAGRRVVAAVPPYHIYGLLFGVLVPLLGGGSMSRSAPLQPAELVRELTSAQAEVLVAVPPHLAALAAYEGALPSLHRVFSSAAPLPADVAAALAARGLVVTEVLGSTETGGIAFRTSPEAPWCPLPSVRVLVADDDALCVESPWLPANQAQPLRTNDRVAQVEGGFRHLGRSDAVVKIGGRRIDLGELETRLKQQAGVRDARVLALPQPSVRGVELVAVVEADGTHAVDPGALKQALRQHVDPVALPRRFRIVPQLPRSPSGKLTRGALLALFEVAEFAREQLADGRVRFEVSHDSVYFRGHFDGQPILPGVVQLERMAIAEARRRFPELGPLTRMTRVKFKRLIAPGESLVLTLRKKGEGVVAFELEVAEQPAASGQLHFAPRPA